MQPMTATLPKPVKVLPLQQKMYSPVLVFQTRTAFGFDLSCTQALNTFTVKLQVVVLFKVQVTVVVPGGKIIPEAGLQTMLAPTQLVVGEG